MDLNFIGGPLDGEGVHGLAVRIIEWALPPFVCFNVEGRYEHYVKEEGEENLAFRHVGACHLIALADMHPPCGHDHTEEW